MSYLVTTIYKPRNYPYSIIGKPNSVNYFISLLKAVFDWAWPAGRNKGHLPEITCVEINKEKVMFLKDSKQKYPNFIPY